MMSEIERIIEKGLVSDRFLVPETVCDFFVDEKRKKLWYVSLDLLSEIDFVCKKFGLKYYLFWGTLLGAIRHQGFIPWDDDIDIAMPRSDYEKLMALSKEFAEPYFLQTPYTDPGYFFSYNKLRNSNTSAVSRYFQYESFNQGIGLDIFPLDSYSMEGVEERFSQVRELVIDLGTYMRMRNPHLDESNKRRVATYSGRNPMETYQMIQIICQADNDKNCDMMGWMSGYVYGPRRQSFRREDLEETMLMDFCGLEVPIPRNYDVILKTMYGNYMELPPKEQRGSWHSGVIEDADTPYKDYLLKDGKN